MPALRIRIEPGRAPGVDLDAVAALFEQAAALADAELTVTQVEDAAGSAITFDFLTADLVRLWGLLQGQVLDHPDVAAPLARASVATCKGRGGWADARVLHHYDRRVLLDPINPTG